ncbi:MAG: hypothetical protein AABO58_03390 [Acidobacteriota bacterium]
MFHGKSVNDAPRTEHEAWGYLVINKYPQEPLPPPDPFLLLPPIPPG